MQENPLMAGLGLPREPRPLTLVIFGASGDLTRGKLVPALFSLYIKGSIPGVRVVGFARRDWTRQSSAPLSGDGSILTMPPAPPRK